ncbi:SIS domain-containing protein [Petrimonas mucosa]|jgi:D-sedoheptulose 7-phosphate isomerase|uniref:Phosphoheptose isomerase n=1 Tax=Petrimonas mucosa TaxID=1642646 RepID=A0A1G4G407_9BACT|nr:SIS domain-containing protein [Petrimonas mucosa]SCM55412.1 Phosphoheptose isomerase {ECO:0000255/HAMAP-Rule:MF_00067} [Petrimonas mucosa]SFU58530.1 D-sedoheptulose 7-phosphate isomerase [Porphyromonadaceae bacterium KHP3R9]
MKKILLESLQEAHEALQEFMTNEENLQAIINGAAMISNALQKGNKVICCGNGGSLCDATHFAEELTGKFRDERVPLPAISINDAAHITCVGNDYSFSEIFSRHIDAIGQKGDILLAISTSGNSENVLKACESARKREMYIIGLTSDSANSLRTQSDVAICAPRKRYSDRIQEIHIKVIHIMIQLIEYKRSLE